jgi:hypothetical protein
MDETTPNEPGRRPAGERVARRGTYRDAPAPKRASGDGPDVYLDVPLLKVDEILLDVENLEAHVSLDAAVLDLLHLKVGADVSLGKVNLEINGVEAQALLEVRLDNVAEIVDRVLTTIDRNPEILQSLGRGLESAVRDVGGGAGRAVGDLGTGVAGAVEDVGEGAGGALEGVGEGAGGALKGVGGAVDRLGSGAAGAVRDVAGGLSGEAPRQARRRPRSRSAETGSEDDDGTERPALHDVLRETEKSVRRLQALLRAASERVRSPQHEEERP